MASASPALRGALESHSRTVRSELPNATREPAAGGTSNKLHQELHKSQSCTVRPKLQEASQKPVARGKPKNAA
eukprot:1153098-Pelagomonas_calceolata.AAC.9